MKNLFGTLGMAALFGMTTTGCMKVTEGEQVFTITANRYFIGKTIEDAEAAVPAGATITNVMISKTFFDLVQLSSISGYKADTAGDRKVNAGVLIHEGDKTFSVVGSKALFGPSILKTEQGIPDGANITDVFVMNSLFGLFQTAAISGTK
jgi:hypothetical protein